MTDLEKEFFQCQKQDILSYLLLPMLKVTPCAIGEEYFRTYLTFSGKIVITASTVKDTFKFYIHPDFLLSFRELDKIYIVFNHPKQYEPAIIAIMNGKYSELPSSYINLIKIYSGLPVDFPVYGGGKYSHPIIEGLINSKKLKRSLKKVGLDYQGEALPPLDIYEDLIDLDTVIN